MKFAHAIVGLLLACITTQVHAVEWNRPNTAPYITQAQLVEAVVVRKMTAATTAAVSRRMFSAQAGEQLKTMGVALLLGRSIPSGCRLSKLDRGLKLTLMSSGEATFVPDVTVGAWVDSPGDKPIEAWICRVEDGQGREVYLVIPLVCNNVAFAVWVNNECIPCPVPCDESCKVYVREHIT